MYLVLNTYFSPCNSAQFSSKCSCLASLFGKSSGDITPAMRFYPLSRFFYMCCFDSIASFLTFIASPGSPGPLTALLMQMIVPLNIVLSYYFLGARYSAKQLSGAGLVVLRCFFALLPLFLRSESQNTAPSSCSHLLPMFVFALSRFPIAVSYAYFIHALPPIVYLHCRRPVAFTRRSVWT